jgi:subtilase family serine protease
MSNIPSGMKRIEGSMRTPAPGAKLIGPAAPDETIVVSIYIRRRPDAPPLLDHEHWAKTPPGKRKFLSREEFAAKYGAAQADADRVTRFAISQGLKVEETSLAKCSVRVSGTVKQMNQAFGVELTNYEVSTDEGGKHTDTGQKGKRTYRGVNGPIHVPTELASIIQNVMGLDARPMGHAQNVPASTVVMTPPWVAQLYQFPAVTAAIQNQTIALIELGGGFSQSDIDAYFGNGPHATWSPLLAPNTPHPTPGLTEPTTAGGTLVTVPIGNGANNYSTTPGSGKAATAEVTLDIVTAASVAPGAKIAVYFANSGGGGGTFSTAADWADAISTAVMDATNKPSVISLSWGGGPENNASLGWTIAEMNTVSTAFQAAAMMGVTVLTPSGDFGSDDFVKDGKAHLDYPASDPWVVSCGGTIISGVAGSTFVENTWNDGTAGSATGGGISEVFPLPSWQQNAGVPVSANPGGTAGRGIPDISGNASLFSGYAVVLGANPFPIANGSNGFPEANGGTSLVAPLYAGLVAILNAYLGTPVGFLNPTLYGLNGTSVFNNIHDSGNNQNPNSNSGAPFYVSGPGPGWNACTGLGSVNGSALLAALQQMQPAVSLILDRSTFGQDEVNAKISAGNGTYKDSFYVVVDGFTPDELGLNQANLNAPPNLPAFSGSFWTLAMPGATNGVQIAFDSQTGVLLEQSGNYQTIQRITFPFNVTFSNTNAFTGLSSMTQTKTYGLQAKITNTTNPGGYAVITTPLSAIANFELVFQADPFMVAGENWWVSNDIRVFQVTPNTLPASKVPLANSSTAYTSDPNTYIKALLTELNTGFTNPATLSDPMATPFDGISSDEETSALSLTANDTSGNAVYNFALARVHIVSDTAMDVRLFFRLFISTSPDTDFNTATTFRSVQETDANGNGIAGSLIPLLGFPTSDMPSTIPFFAEPRINTSSQPMSQQTDPANVQTLPSPLAPAPAQGQETYAYFGCWLDINQSTPLFPLNPSAQTNPDGPYPASAALSIPALIMGNHACLITEISYDPDPIPGSANASTSDKIGQRNLAWVGSDNPGPVDGHRVPMLFDLRHTSKAVPPEALPDELMIEWGDTPTGSVASIYWPQFNADDVLKLARRFDRSSQLTKKDAHTIQCVAGGVTYIPIPAGTGPNLAGLLTVDLPLSVRVGERFNIVIRRLTTKNPKLTKVNADTRNWRYVVGAFQLAIPVSTGADLLATDESALALFKWKLKSLPHTNRWYAVIERYIEELSGRVDSFGGVASTVEPTQLGTLGTGHGHGGGFGHPGDLAFTGKVDGIAYDRFGDFEGFLLRTEAGHEQTFRSREREIEELVRDAWLERMVITVFVDRRQRQIPVSIVLRRRPPERQ